MPTALENAMRSLHRLSPPCSVRCDPCYPTSPVVRKRRSDCVEAKEVSLCVAMGYLVRLIALLTAAGLSKSFSGSWSSVERTFA